MKKIIGSCHCSNIEFELETAWPYPIEWCYCNTCRKTNGSPVIPFIKGEKKRLHVTKGQDLITVYRVRTNERHFCKRCGSSLYLTDTRWPQHCWPMASAIETPLPKCPKHIHIFSKFKPDWFPIDTPGPKFDEYPELSIEEWHKELSLNVY